MLKTITLRGRRVEYTLERKRVKNINLRMRRDGSIYVSAARMVPQAAIDAFILNNADSILSYIDRASKRTESERELADGQAVQLYGVRYPVMTLYAAKNSVQFINDQIIIAMKNPEDAGARKRILDKWLREECMRAINDWCQKVYPSFQAMGVRWPQEIKLRRMTGRWGSCQPVKGVLTFNTALVHAPPECIEYVVTHEFCHFIHPDHSPAFHALMTRLMPDWKARKKKLNETPLDAGK